MATNPHGILLTYEDYAQIPSDRNRYEILNGVLAVTPAPTTLHQDAVTNLVRILSGYVRRNGLG
jgi:Uma2 family endonuclease